MIGHWLVLVPLVLIPLTVAVSMLIRRPLTRLLGANMQESAQRTAHLFETMNGVDTLKCLGAEAWARRTFDRGHGTLRSFTRVGAPTIVHAAVAGIAEACVVDPDDRLVALLERVVRQR